MNRYPVLPTLSGVNYADQTDYYQVTIYYTCTIQFNTQWVAAILPSHLRLRGRASAHIGCPECVIRRVACGVEACVLGLYVRVARG